MALLLGLAVAILGEGQVSVVDAVTYDSQPKEIYVPVREAAKGLRWPMAYDPVVELVDLRGETLDPFLPRLSDGTFLIPLKDLKRMGAVVKGKTVSSRGGSFSYEVGSKRVSVDLRKQRLWAWQGKRLVFDWPVSSGREGKETPTGSFKALGKEEMHISSIYGSPMPYSVHVTGNIFIHGSGGFSGSPGSHGCIRLPLMARRNVAEEFFNWIELGVPIKVRGSFIFQKPATRN